MIIKPNRVLLNNDSSWEPKLTQLLRERGNYTRTDNELNYEQLAVVFTGAFDDLEAYKEYLYTLATEELNRFECLFKGFNKDIENSRFQDIQKVMNIYEKDNLSMNRFIAFLEGYNLLPFRNEPYYRHFRECFRTVLDLYISKYGKSNPTLFKRVVVDLIKWSWNHIHVWSESLDFYETTPRILWYGDAKESEVYFLYLSYLLGFDVVVFHPSRTNIFQVLATADIQVVDYPSVSSLFEFPIQKPTRRSTVAQKASNQLNEVLYDENSNVYRPWQFRDYIPQPITLKTTYDEIFILQPEKAMFRQGFKAREPYVEIPNLFSKVAGVTKDRSEYKNRIKKLTAHRLFHAVNSFPMTEKFKPNMQLHYRSALSADGETLDAEKLLVAQYWPYKQLALSLQKGLAEVISRVVYQAELKNSPNESNEAKRLYLFGQMMTLPEPILRLLQQFDYTQEIPLLLLCNDENNGQFSREDAATLLLLNQLGVDILLFNPTGQSDIELFIDEIHYDSHWLEEMTFEEQFPITLFTGGTQRESAFKKIIKKLF